MRSTKYQIIQSLLEQSPQTSQQLSTKLALSKRSVKSYVQRINQEYGGVIHASYEGYYMQREAALQCLCEEDSLPQTQEERSIYILKKLLMEHHTSLDLYDLCEELCIGYSTLKTQIQRMNKAYANFDIRLICKNDHVGLVGSEKDKRKVVSHILVAETKEKFIHREQLIHCFPHIDGKHLENRVYEIMQKYHYYLHDFSYMNMVVHLTILIDRVKENEILPVQKEIKVTDEHEKEVLSELCSMIEEDFQICLSDQERFEIYVLFKTNANTTVEDNMKSLSDIANPALVEFIRVQMEQIMILYGVSLQNESFLIPFAIHLKGLFFRMEHGTYVKNPFARSMRASCPLIYDIAVYLSVQIALQQQLQMKEDEIAYMALHLGAEIERQQMNETKIRCILLCPNYQSMNTHLYNQILSRYGNLLHIIYSYGQEQEVMEECDLLITTMPVEHVHNCEIFLLAPFTLEAKSSELSSCIQRIMNDKKQDLLKNELHRYLHPELFFLDWVMQDKYEVINMLSNAMQRQGYVEATFLDAVILREQTSSTAFGNIAIPHAIHEDAIKSGIGIFVSEEGIVWDEQVVRIVFMIAIHAYDKRVFSLIYEALVTLFENEHIMKKLVSAKSFREFEDSMQEGC